MTEKLHTPDGTSILKLPAVFVRDESVSAITRQFVNPLLPRTSKTVPARRTLSGSIPIAGTGNTPAPTIKIIRNTMIGKIFKPPMLGLATL
jgi:hypothetical protein